MTQKVLIVDDTEINLILFGALVKKLDHCEAHTFDAPRQALAWAKDNAMDLVIVDYMMPDIDGLEFIRQLREMPGRDAVPILMITANDQKQIRYRALDSGAERVVRETVEGLQGAALSLNEGRRS